MRLTQNLLGWLSSVFSKDPQQFLALRFDYDGTMTWTVADGVLSTAVSGGTGAAISVNLSGYTISSLAAYLATLTGYSVPYVDTSANASLSAMTLLDGSGTPAQSNGDHLYAYTSILYVIMDAIASEFTTAQNEIPTSLLQMAITTASDEWLDELGAYYNVPRNTGELDAAYGPRIISQVVRPLGNNIAMAQAIQVGVQYANGITVTDAPSTTQKLSQAADGSFYLDPTSGVNRQVYGLFDVNSGFDLEGSVDITTFVNQIKTVVEAYRDAGTFLRNVSVTGTLTDAANLAYVDTEFETAAIAGFSETYGSTPGPQYYNGAIFYNALYDYSGATIAYNDTQSAFNAGVPFTDSAGLSNTDGISLTINTAGTITSETF